MNLATRIVLASVGVTALAGITTHSSATANSVPRPLVFQLKGGAIGVDEMIDTTGDGVPDMEATCFDIDLYDPNTGRRIGTARDCLSGVNVVIDDAPANAPFGWNLALTGTTFFELPPGTLVTQGLTTVRPVLQPTMRDGIVFTHITGANGDGGVRYGTGPFAGADGQVRLSGLVDLSRLVTHNEITFDCMFVVDPVD
jgi:hypothetical protein